MSSKRWIESKTGSMKTADQSSTWLFIHERKALWEVLTRVTRDG